MKVKLYTALKSKNRLASEVKRLAAIFQRINCWEVGKESNHDPKKMLTAYEEAVKKLVKVKAAIASANTGIYEKIEKMAELKSQIVLYQSLDTKKGIYKESLGDWSAKTTVEVKYDCYINRESVDSLVNDAQKMINNLQDEIDEYNATTEVKLPD